jgi:hypothetical protein
MWISTNSTSLEVKDHKTSSGPKRIQTCDH